MIGVDGFFFPLVLFSFFLTSSSLVLFPLLPYPSFCIQRPFTKTTLQEEVDAAISKLKDLKLELEKAHKARQAATNGGGGAAAASSGGKKKGAASAAEVFRAAVANALERRLFYLPSFKIYGAVAGFYDYGPPGCAVKQNVTQLWRRHFVLEEGMLEVECPAVTPEVVLRASGHVDRFTDFMVSDATTGDCHRADHLLEDALQKLLDDDAANLTPHQREEARELLATVEELTADGLGDALDKYSVKAPETGNALSRPYAFNLMFKTSIGPRGDQVGYLRPETAQGIFVNFRDLLYYNGNRLPFAAAQIGQSYRNEISPKAGLLRVREFTQAEIEHFCSPEDKSHPKFDAVADLTPLLFSRELQMGSEKVAKPMSLREAVSQKVIANETLAYFIGRTHLFMLAVGVDPARLRFRQHLVHEMAHYAEDCWDAEVHCSYGWIECAGLADRSAYDLTAHAAKSKQDLSFFEKFDAPRTVTRLVAKPKDRKALGIAFKKEARGVLAALEALDEEGAATMQKALASEGKAPLLIGGEREPCGEEKAAAASSSSSSESTTVEVTPDLVVVESVTSKVSGRSIVPSVIEPSFGIGRIIYCAFEHSFYVREEAEPAAAAAASAAASASADGKKGGSSVGDAQRTVFRFTPAVAPVKVTVFPLLNRENMDNKAREIERALTGVGLATLVDTTSTTVGKRYARTDEIGVPFGVTVDGESVEGDGSVTLRERDSMAQVRIPSEEVPGVVRALVDGKRDWESVRASYPAQVAGSDK